MRDRPARVSASVGSERASSSGTASGSPLLVLIVSLAATAIAWYGLKKQAEDSAAAEFEGSARQITQTIGTRMRAYEESLHAVVALFATSRIVTREDWRRFADGLDLRRDHPGIEVLGFAKHLQAPQIDAHEREMRSQGLPEYGIWPAGVRDEYVAITFLEPLSATTRRLLGFDMLTGPTSHEVVLKARDSATVSLSGRWSAAADSHSERQAGLLMVEPVYSRPETSADTETGADTPDNVRRNPIGYVYAALRCEQLVADMLRDSAIDIGVAVYDGDEALPDKLLYADTRAVDALHGRAKPAFMQTMPLTVAGREWTLRFFSPAYDKVVTQRQLPLIALAAGVPLSLLLFGIAWSQATLRARAVQIAQDMTGSLRAQAGLLDLTHDAVFLRDRDNIIRYWNRAASDTYGFSADEAIGRTADDLLRTRFSQPREQIWSELQSTGRWEGEVVHTRRDGSELIVTSRWAVQKDAHGAIEAILETNNDVTDHRRAEQERRRLEASLLQASKLEAMGTLAGGIAHDFNNILGAILGYGELAQAEAKSGPLSRYIAQIMSAGQRAKSLVARILAFSRSGLGQRRPVHVQAVVAEALDLLAASLPEDVQLERRLTADDAAVIGDATQIHQVALNLCTNALQAMKSGGTLSVRLEAITTAVPVTLVTGTLAPGDYVRLSVSDTGPGIEPSLRDRIFDPFFTTKGVGVGTGLGLSLVHGIATDLGGGVDMNSELGRGTTFHVYMPCSGRAPLVEQEREVLPQGHGETVMLVDDEEALVRLGEEMIARLGYEPVGYTSATEALAAFRADPQRFAVVLSDETMPGMTGSQLAEHIRAIDENVPIVLMSGYAAAPLAARAQAVGAVDLLNKPLLARDIARSLERALRARGFN